MYANTWELKSTSMDSRKFASTILPSWKKSLSRRQLFVTFKAEMMPSFTTSDAIHDTVVWNVADVAA
jgi:hypothetical protein